MHRDKKARVYILVYLIKLHCHMDVQGCSNNQVGLVYELLFEFALLRSHLFSFHSQFSFWSVEIRLREESGWLKPLTTSQLVDLFMNQI